MHLLPLLGAVAGVAVAQDPSGAWKPNFESLGPQCYSNAPNPNIPDGGHHDGGCGCENTLMRIDGKLIIMESTQHGCQEVFPGTTEDCSYFRIRDVNTGTCTEQQERQRCLQKLFALFLFVIGYLPN